MMQVPMGIPPPNPMLMVQQQSQNMLGSQTLPMVGGHMVPRSLPSMQNFKNSQDAGSPMVPATGDATPTDEDGTSVSSPSSAQKPATTQPGVNQYNHMMNLHSANRPMLPVPPPNSSSAPIPYPPPNVGYNFPPPGIRQPGMPPNSQFSWMHKSGQFNPEADPRQGMPLHPFNRPPTQSPVKDSDRRSVDMDQSASPIHPDKSDSMVISTDDESSMDRDFEVQAGGRFPGATTEFPRMPMGMHRMRGPPMQGGPRFPNMPMGAPPFLNPRVGGPRGMGMHPGHRMEEFSSQRGGPRMPGVPPPEPQRGEGPPRGPPPPSEGRDWYKRDFEAPPFERPFRDDRNNRDPWKTAEGPEGESRQGGQEERHDERTRDYDKRDSRDRQGLNTWDRPPPRGNDDDFNIKQRPRPVKKKSENKDLSNDLFSLRFYQRDKKPELKTELKKELVKRKMDDSKAQTSEKPTNKAEGTEKRESQAAIDARKEREARKRSRWGRTLSEEREYQEQRKCEIELKRTEVERKFQSYEQSVQASQALLSDSVEATENSDSLPGAVKAISDDATTNVEDVANSTNEPGAVPEPENPIVESVAQQVDSVPDTVSVPASSESEFTTQPANSEASTNSAVAEPAPETADSDSRSQVTTEEAVPVPVHFTESISNSEVDGSAPMSPEANSLPLSSNNNNHVDCEEAETTSLPTLMEVTCKSTLEEAIPNPLATTTTTTNDTHLSEDTNAAESSSANELVPSLES